MAVRRIRWQRLCQQIAFSCVLFAGQPWSDIDITKHSGQCFGTALGGRPCAPRAPLSRWLAVLRRQGRELTRFTEQQRPSRVALRSEASTSARASADGLEESGGAAFASAPTNVEGLKESGDAAFANNDFVQAQIQYEAAIEMMSRTDSGDALQRAALFAKAGDAWVGVPDLRRALARYEAAQKALDEDVRFSAATRAELLIKMGYARRETGDAEQAFFDYEAARKLLEATGELDTQAGAVLLACLGEMHAERGMLQVALAEYQTSCRVREALQGGLRGESDADLLVKMGIVYSASGDSEAALSTWEAAREIYTSQGMLITPEVADLRTKIGSVLMQRGDASAALVELKAARQTLESCGLLATTQGKNVLMALGDAYTEVDQFEQAIEAFEAVCTLAEQGSLEPDDVDIDELFAKIEDMRSGLRHSDATKLFEESDPFDDGEDM